MSRHAKVLAQGKNISPCDCCYQPSLDVIRDKLQLRWVTLDIDIVIAHTDATVAQLLSLCVRPQLEPFR